MFFPFKLVVLFIILGVFSTMLFAQKTQTICGEYTYNAPENVSPEQAKQTALERAKLEALAKEFGTIVSQNNATAIKNENEKSDIRFFSLSGSEVKGEWLEDTKTPEYTTSYEQNMLIVSVSICGKAREITGAGVDFSAKILCNGVDARYENDRFKNGDDIYLLFQAPVDGYLAVYLLDDTPTAYCLLPYRSDASGQVKVNAGKEYVFFSKKHADHTEVAMVDEYTLTAQKSVEQNSIYVIFSPNEFTKANDRKAAEGELVLPRELPFEEFQVWLVKNRNRDKEMKVEHKNLMIKKETK
jgi:hypothetical protein